MLILAFDTTSEKGGVGIYRGAECLALVPNDGPANGFSVALFEMVGLALAQAHLELREIELYAAANGPGSFTGIRVGLAAAQAWGKAFGRPVCGVSVLEAMVNKRRYEKEESEPAPRGEGARWGRGSERTLTAQASPDWYLPLLDARRGEFYLGSFRRNPAESPSPDRERYELADTGWVLKPEALRTVLEERLANGVSATALVCAHDQAAAGLRALLPDSLNWQQVESILVDAIAGIALREEHSRGLYGTPLDAYYIRRPDAEVNWKE